MQWPCFAFHYKPTISVYAKGSLHRGPIAMSLLRVGFSLLGNEGVHISASPLHLLMVFGTGPLGCQSPLLLESPPLVSFPSASLDGRDRGVGEMNPRQGSFSNSTVGLKASK